MPDAFPLDLMVLGIAAFLVLAGSMLWNLRRATRATENEAAKDAPGERVGGETRQ